MQDNYTESTNNNNNDNDNNKNKDTNTNANANTNTLSLTPSAIKYLKKQLNKNPTAIGIKLGVKDAGCSGKAYTIDFVSKLVSSELISNSNNGNLIIEIEGIKIIVDNASVAYLKGTKLDCEQKGLNETLKFINPNVINECGCGESFQVK